jgi:hypothetical protein
MGIRTLIAYLFGSKAAILQIASNPWAPIRGRGAESRALQHRG